MANAKNKARLSFEGHNQDGLTFLEEYWDSFYRQAKRVYPKAVPVKVQKKGLDQMTLTFDWQTLLRWFEHQGPRDVPNEAKALDFLEGLEQTALSLFGMKCVNADIPT